MQKCPVELRHCCPNTPIYAKAVITSNTRFILTKNESRLLELFLSNKNKFIQNEEIIKHIWSDKEVSSSAFKSLINRLTNKIGKDLISNSFGIGYGIIER